MYRYGKGKLDLNTKGDADDAVRGRDAVAAASLLRDRSSAGASSAPSNPSPVVGLYKFISVYP